MIKAILFDGDGMIINKPMVFSARFSRDFDIPMDDILPFFQGEFQQCLVGKADLKEVIMPYLTKWKWNKSVDELLEYWFQNENYIDNRMVSDIKEYRARGIKCYLHSNQEKYRTDFMRDIMGFGDLVDGIFSSAYLGVKKPQGQFWDAILDNINLSKPDVLVWDDDEENVKSAREYGLAAELYTEHDTFKHKMKDYLQ